MKSHNPLKALTATLLLAPLLAAYAGDNHSVFEVGDGTFLLDGKPFVVRAAEVHYPRIPMEYWEHRIRMCKALGMNTLCLYIFWNLHEQTPGSFDFTGNNDVAAFCRLAQDNGMFVILRPGPYVCAEWDMGGIPWWLLRNDSIRLRAQDPVYMSHVGAFMREVGRQLQDMQLSRGGNIIMVQVENEYGSYAVDKAYIAAIRDTIRAAGFTDVPLFQCDWSSNFLNNGLDDLLWTLNFGTGADIDKQFEELRKRRPHAPLMCSEYWSGWYDRWGCGHETRDFTVMVDGIRQMLERGISFSLYMTHGGTTFGWWGGANDFPYSPMCSSYDYDAPISEAGQTSDKYMALRAVLKDYLPEGEELPDIPDALPVMSVPDINFTQICPIIMDLPEAIHAVDIMSMEEICQGWGSVLYRTRLPADVQSGTVLRITEQHDWTQVFADGRLIGTLDRRHGQQQIILPALKAGTRLDLLVEATGRVNFGRSINDRKGITDKVELVAVSPTDRRDGSPAVELKDWSIYGLPATYQFAAARNYREMSATRLVDEPTGYDAAGDSMRASPSPSPVIPHVYAQSAGSIDADETLPAYYRATFSLDTVADTFLDMSTWGKGMVWVNGHALGRFWEIGPQQTLYMPGCWLRRGDNEIIVLDLKGPISPVVRGSQTPVLDELHADADE